jgi:hypothetical protein
VQHGRPLERQWPRRWRAQAFMAADENRRIAFGTARYVIKTVEADDSNGPARRLLARLM